MSNFTNVNPNKHNICLVSQVFAIFWLEQVDLTLFISRSVNNNNNNNNNNNMFNCITLK